MDNIRSSMFITFISLLILNMLIIFFGVYSYFFSVTDYTLIAGIIAFFGAIIGGSITLVGVSKTIQENKIKENKEKYLVANYIFTELHSKFTEVNNKIKSISSMNISTLVTEIEESSRKLLKTAIEMKEESKKIDLLIYREVKTMEYNSKRICDTINNFVPGTTDLELKKELMNYRNELSKADNNLWNYKNEIKHS